MKKMHYILIFTILASILFQGTAAAKLSGNIYLDDDLNPALGVEYLAMDRVTVNGAFVFSEDAFDKPFILETGIKYYFFDITLQDYTEGGGAFAEATLVTTILEEGNYSDLNLGAGYFQPISEKVGFSIGGGFTLSEVDDHDFYIKAGLNYSLSNLFSEDVEDDSSEDDEGNKGDRRAYLEEKYDWEEDMVEAVLNQEVQQGMNTEQIRESLGEPDRIEERGDRDYWIYESFDSGEGKLRQLIVFIEAEELTDWEVNEVEL